MRNRVHFYKWPLASRTSEGGHEGTMHAKAVIADERVAFLTSAGPIRCAVDQPWGWVCGSSLAWFRDTWDYILDV